MTAPALDRTATVVVAGTGLAGLRAAETLRAEGFDGRVVMVGDERHRPYDRPPLSKQYLSGAWDRDRIWLRAPDKLDALGLEWRLGRRAEACDPTGRTVTLDGGEELPYDGLVVAGGAWPRTFAGAVGVPGVHVLRRLEDADAMASVLAAGDARVVVIGAGFVGTEVAATARRLGATVTLLDPLPTPLGRALGEVVGGVCVALHREEGVDVRTGVAAVALATADGDRRDLGPVVTAPLPAPGGPAPAGSDAATGAAVTGVELADGSVLPADLVVVGIGVAPATGWLQGSGLALEDGVVVDQTLHAAEAVVAAGDLARWTVPATGTSRRIEHWTNASEQGVVAARSLLAGRAAAEVYDPVPYVWSDQFDLKVQVLGLPSADDDVTVVDGSLAEGRFVAVYSRSGTVTGAVGFGRPRQLMGLRPLVQRAAAVDEATTLFGA